MNIRQKKNSAMIIFFLILIYSRPRLPHGPRPNNGNGLNRKKCRARSATSVSTISCYKIKFNLSGRFKLDQP